MAANSVVGQQHETTGTSSATPTTQAGRMRAAVDHAVAFAPRFLRGEVDADQMANTMVDALRTYAEQERAAGGDGTPRTAEAQSLQGAIAELTACGTGYLAGRCDGACVARTMTEMVHEFAKH